ncbi:serine carboxypeptidase [Amylocystis lapponica]|nr:serine carboxypeptidase [Amylocystis lapponica]
MLLWTAVTALFVVLNSVLGSPAGPRSTSDYPPLRVNNITDYCETTPGVYQATGYANISSEDSIWFWFFEARQQPEQAPFTVWINGGPGSSSMVGLFQEHGPCLLTNDSSDVTLNPNSWNEVSNVIYVDQPIGTGFSYGTEQVNTTEQAAASFWTFLQVFFADPQFSKYQERDFALWTESYGGRYGPLFAKYFLDQNLGIIQGSVQGVPINLKVLGIGDGIIDPLIQYGEYASYARNNPYYPLVSESQIQTSETNFTQSGGCRDEIISCYVNATDYDCAAAQLTCDSEILDPLFGKYYPYYILQTGFESAYPPDPTSYLNNTKLMASIGAESKWQETNSGVLFNFQDTGDGMRKSTTELEHVINSGVHVVIYEGDADYLYNYMGVEAVMDSLNTSASAAWAEQSLSNWTVTGQSAGLYKNAGVISYVRVYGAGHEVAAYSHGDLNRGQAALEMFRQAMSGQEFHST